MAFKDFVEEIQVLGRDLVDKVRALIHEGNVRRVIIKDEQGRTFIEIPVTVAAIGAVAAPILAAGGDLRPCGEVHNCSRTVGAGTPRC